MKALAASNKSHEIILKNTESLSVDDFDAEGKRERITGNSPKLQISLDDAAYVIRTLEHNNLRDDGKYLTTTQLNAALTAHMRQVPLWESHP